MEFQHWPPCPPGSPLLAQPLAGVAVPIPAEERGSLQRAPARGTERSPAAHSEAAGQGPGGSQRTAAARSQSCSPGAPQSCPCHQWVPRGRGLPVPPPLSTAPSLSPGSAAAWSLQLHWHPRAVRTEGKWRGSAPARAPMEHLSSATTRHISPPLGLTIPQAESVGNAGGVGGMRLQMEGQPLENPCQLLLPPSWCCPAVGGHYWPRGYPTMGQATREKARRGPELSQQTVVAPRSPAAMLGLGILSVSTHSRNSVRTQ